MAEKEKRMSDLQPIMPAIDEKINKDAILDKDMVFVEIQDLVGKHGDFLFVVVTEKDGKERLGFTTGAAVVCQKLKSARDNRNLPIIGKLVLKNNYYDII